VQSKDSREHIP